MATRKQQQAHFDRFVAEQRGTRYPSVISVIVKEAGYRYNLMRRLEWALQCKWSHEITGCTDPTMDEALAIVAEEFKLTYAPPQQQ